MLELLLNNSFFAAVLAFALVLIPAIIIHELGHFFAAKWAGINVLEFGIGFPPRMARLFMWGETEFTLNWLPIGGFVRPLGEDMIGPIVEKEETSPKTKKQPQEMYLSEREELRARGIHDKDMLSVNEAKPWPRIVFMAAGAFANFLSAILFLIIMALLGLPTDVGGRLQLVSFPNDSMFATGQVAIGDAIERINGEYFSDTQAFLTFLQDLSGQEITLAMRSLETGAAYEIIITPAITETFGYVFVSAVEPDSPADKAGLQVGDLLTALNGQRISAKGVPAGELIELVNANAGQTIELTVLRSETSFTVTVTPRLKVEAGKGRIGIAIASQYVTDDGVRYATASSQQELIPLGLGDAVQYGVGRFLETIQLIISIPMRLIDGSISPEEARPVSIVGISQVGGQFIQQSIREGSPIFILNFVALVSIFLGFTNLLPLPPLDGGRIVFVLIEVIRKKPVPPQVEAFVYQIGIAFLLVLAVVIIIYDIINPLVLPQ